MKKYSEFELIGIGITLLVLCILISVIGKHVFDLEGDYLSAAATLFAAVVAMLLFNDWREPHRVSMIQSDQQEIRASVRDFRNNYYAFSAHVLMFQNGESTRGAYFTEYMRLEANLLNSLDDVSEKLEFYSRHFKEESLDIDYMTHRSNLIVYSELIQQFNAKFNNNNPYTDFPKTYAFVNCYITNGFFLNVVERLTKDLIEEISIISNNLLKDV